MRYPPFGTLARVLASEPTRDGAEGKINAAAALLREAAERCEVRLLGPSPAPLERLRNRYRFHLMLHAQTDEALHGLLLEVWPEIRRKIGGLALDVQPQDVM